MENPGRRWLFNLFLLLGFAAVVIAGLWLLNRSDILKHGLRAAEQNQPGLYPINHFVDGDTIAVNMNGSVETIRMIGVDTPETHKPNTPVQCYGLAAAAYTKSLIGNNKIRLRADSLDTNRDRYGRLLRYIYLPDGRLVEEQLIQNGYGFAYKSFPFEKLDGFTQLESQAKQASKGLWGACQVTIESNGIEQTNAAN